ncbi:hypothetical protein Y032_0020g149 [Ancylostoma ceylanicum]|uniref:Uncharacterized protein n=1 Tax=Ancylostoma ceylanicum TaxID=53326 RepID=A0A016V1Q0_9BILA|nr:hypothetical protein Y032_0020g149 [Ancylostoma ceylanicum]
MNATDETVVGSKPRTTKILEFEEASSIDKNMPSLGETEKLNEEIRQTRPPPPHLSPGFAAVGKGNRV